MNVAELFIGIFIAAVALFYLWNEYYYKPLIDKIRRSKSVIVRTKRKKSWPVLLEQAAQRGYSNFLKVPILRNLVRRVRTRIEATGTLENEYQLRRTVMMIIFSLMALVVVVFSITTAIYQSLWALFWTALTLLLANGIIVDLLVHRLEFRLLQGVKELNDQLRFAYQKTKNIQDAFLEAVESTPKSIRKQAEHIYEILMDVESEKKLRAYETLAPSRHLLNIAGMSLMTKEQGDIVTIRGSAFLNALTAINQQVHQETQERSKLWYRMQGFEIISIIPAFLTLPVKWFATANFPVMEQFYNSRFGLISQILCFVVSIGAYLFVRKMKDFYVAKTEALATKNKWEYQVLKRFKLVKRFIARIMPKVNEREYLTVTKLLKEANSSLKMEWLYLRKVLFAAIFFVISIAGLVYSEYRTVTSVYEQPTYSSAAVRPNEEQREIAIRNTQFDNQLIEDLRAANITSRNKIRDHIDKALDNKQLLSTREIEQITNRITEKLAIIDNAYFKWWELVVAFMLGYVGYIFPTWMLRIQKNVTKGNLDNEVFDFLTIISVLRDYPTITTILILKWMERTSVIFRPVIQRIVHEFDSGQEAALNQAKSFTSFTPFLNIIERLRLSLVSISIAEAFNDVDIERQFYLEQKVENGERRLQEKLVLGDKIAMAPLMLLVIGFFVVPLFYVAYLQINSVGTNLL